ncbi:ZIP family metal transporter [Ectopseudomonas khazarica]|uniref:Protein GufA n=3 Tax=Gammaproteobacteria TaxID=1236 RepID=A0A653B779_ECTOL|nr:ZIP family metal transporter [Pseudomonas khazarica]CAE6896727.1 Protein GufA [Pseudomonas oleovorans]HIQ41397.1 ZIP family metal transporter [Pseudomonas oleovorans]
MRLVMLRRTLLSPSAAANGRVLRYLLGGAILFSGALLLFIQSTALLDPHAQPRLMDALQGGLLCALGTASGALPVLFMRELSQRWRDRLLGFGAGVMLAAAVFSLLIPALDVARTQGFGPWSAGALGSAGLLLGAAGLLGLARLLDTRQCLPDTQAGLTPGVLLFVIAIMLHNVPEGMAVGVAVGAGLSGAEGLVIGIALQDVPEGLIVALVLASAGMGRGRAVLIGAASGLVEPLFAVLCAWVVSLSQLLLPWGLALAAGAMLVAVTHEVIPESHGNGYRGDASLALAMGFCLMMVLDTALA